MKKIAITFLLCCLCSVGQAQEQTKYDIGQKESVSSHILNSQRKFWIHLPETYQKDSAVKYPVVYVLDGQTQFQSTVAITEHLSSEGLMPKSIVIGIEQNDRLRELSFGSDPEFPDAKGEGEQFLDHIEKELVPYIDKTYRASAYRTLVGHSLGGLVVAHSLVHRPSLFSNYISLEGALWWDHHRIVKDASAKLGQHDMNGKAVFFALANHFDRKMSLRDQRNDKSSDSDLARANLALFDIVKSPKNMALKSVLRYYPQENHSSVTLLAQYDAFKFVFDFFPLRITNRQLDDAKFDVVAKFTDHYKKVSAHMVYQVTPESSGLVNLGYRYLLQKRFDRAEYFFRELVTHYPNDPNSFDSIGDFYLAKGDKEKAVSSFQKGLSLGEMKETREKLETLLKAQ